jgi:DNA polymerase-3 subunit alpha
MVPIEQASREWTNGVLIKVDAAGASNDTLERLKSTIETFPGDCTTCLKIEIEDSQPVLVKLSDDYMTCSDPLFFKAVEGITGDNTIETRCAPIKERKKKVKPWLNKTS